MSEAVKRVEKLLKLPQELCKTCGKCCRIATFKGGLHHSQVEKIANGGDNDPSQVQGAIDFLTIFTPYPSIEEARKFASEFVDNTLNKLGRNDSEMSFYYCKYISDDNLCLIHEDRPLLCRMYPIPHERTLYFPGCGFEGKGKANWNEIKNILDSLE